LLISEHDRGIARPDPRNRNHQEGKRHQARFSESKENGSDRKIDIQKADQS
jgi:hypothetical protein